MNRNRMIPIFILCFALISSSTAFSQWVQCTTGANDICCFGGISPNFYVAGGPDLARSTDNGETWVRESSLPGDYISAMAAIDTHVIIQGGTAGVLYSSDNGKNWSSGERGLSGLVNSFIAIDQN